MASELELWKARFLPGSFRGIPFFIDGHTFEGGRNVVQHEPPDRESTFSEDMGRRSQGYVVEAHVLGDNYFFIRDALVNAMENPDSGILIHPYLGLKEVQPRTFSLRERVEEGRIARFTLEFTEAGDPSFPVSVIDAITDFISNVVGVVAAVKNAFQLAYTLSQLPGYAVLSAKAIADDFVASVSDSIDRISGKNDETAELKKRLDEFDSATLVRYPASMANEIDGIIEDLKDVPEETPDRKTIDIVSGRDERLDVFDELLNFSPDVIGDLTETTPTREQEKRNALAMRNMIRQLAAVRVAENALEKEFASRDDAVSWRRSILETIDDQQRGDETDDALHAKLADLKSRLTRAVPDPSLASVESFGVDGTKPAIVLAYDLYEDPTRELDIIERNDVFNPCFVSGDLEVLSD